MRPVRPLLALLVLFGLTACGTTPASDRAAAASPAPTRSPQVGCDGQPLPPRSSVLVRLGPDGTERWRADLPEPTDSGGQAVPVHDDERAYVGTDAALRAHDDRTGDLVWERPVAGPVYGLWREGDLLVALLAQVGTAAHAVGLDAATGEQRWRHDVPGGGLLGEQRPTGDGGLAWSLDQGDARTQVLDLETGRVRWTSTAKGQLGSPGAGGGLVLRPEGEGVTAYDARTGAQRWRADGLADALHVEVLGDVAVVGQSAQGLGLDGSVVGLRLADGERLWTADEEDALGVAGTGPGGVVVHTTSGWPNRAALIDPATGAERWRIRAQVALHLPVAAGAATVVHAEGGDSTKQVPDLVGRDAASGREMWRRPLPGLSGPASLLGEDRVLVLRSQGVAGSTAVVVDRRTGAVEAETPLPGYVSRPAVDEDGAILQAADPMTACPGSAPG